MTKAESGYVQAIQETARRAREWVREHPQAQPKIQFNYPHDVAVLAAIDDAKCSGLISTNEDGDKLLAALVDGIPYERQPTILMLRVALEELHSV